MEYYTSWLPCEVFPCCIMIGQSCLLFEPIESHYWDCRSRVAQLISFVYRNSYCYNVATFPSVPVYSAYTRMLNIIIHKTLGRTPLHPIQYAKFCNVLSHQCGFYCSFTYFISRDKIFHSSYAINSRHRNQLRSFMRISQATTGYIEHVSDLFPHKQMYEEIIIKAKIINSNSIHKFHL